MSPLNKSKGNMYPWVTHTWNPIKGKCPHKCSYCYMRFKPIGDLRLDEKCLKDNLGSGKTIFVGSGTDMWAEQVPNKWIQEVLAYSRRFNNTYLFQTKNPKRFLEFCQESITFNSILGTTIETNRKILFSKAPSPFERRKAMTAIPRMFDVMVSIEPIMNFDFGLFWSELKLIKPKFISIGADSKGHNLPEPPPEKIRGLIAELEKFTDVKIKSNLNRLLSKKEKRR